MDLSTLTDEEFQRFIALIYKVSGIRIPPTKKILISNRLRRRVRATGMNGFSEYHAFLTSPAGTREMPLFLDEITTNETYFFRDVHQYQWFGDEFLPEIARRGSLRQHPKRLRIWSAAASTGAELYSLAIRIQEQRHLFAGWSLQLLGTDLSGAVLESARQGVYDSRTLRLVDAPLRKKYFDEDAKNQRWTIKPEIREMATWKVHNLMQPLKEEPFDCIFLKNVLIYFDPISKQTVARHMIAALAKQGHLILGPTEVISKLLESLTKKKTWLFQRET